MKSTICRDLHAAIVVIVCAAIAAACNSSSPVEVDSTFEAAATSSWFDVSPAVVDFGSSGTSAQLRLENDSKKGVRWNASESAGWLSLSSTSGKIRRRSARKLSLSVERTGLAAGDYATDVAITTDRGTTQTVRVKMTVAGAGSTSFAVAPLILDFGTTTSTMSLELKNAGNSSINWTANEGKGWLSLSNTSGTIAAHSQQTISVSVSRSGKSSGTYGGRIRFAAGTSGSAEVRVRMTVPSSSSESVLLAGQLVNQFTGSAMSGITVQYAGKSATTNSSGMFTIAGSPTSSLQQLTLTGSNIHKRVTFARTGDSRWQVAPSSFNMAAFNDVARDEMGASTVRWVTPPKVYIDSRPEGFSSTEMSTWISDVKVQAAEFISKWSGAVIQPSSVVVTSSPPTDLTTGTIVIHFSENSADYAGSSVAIGYTRFSSNFDRSMRAAAVWLRYSRYPGSTKAGKRKGILGHELGHAMGLGHMDGETASFMHPSIGKNTDLSDFDRQVASFLYTRSPANTPLDVDNSGSFLGDLVATAAPGVMEWVCSSGEEITSP